MNSCCETSCDLLKGIKIIVLLISFVVFPLLTLEFMKPKDSFENLRAKARLEKLQRRQTDDQDKLNNYGWVNEKAGVARIPIDKAMELQVERLKNKPVKPADLIVNPSTTK